MVEELSTISKDELRKIFSEVFDEKLAELKMTMIPQVSDEEMEEIKTIHGDKPQFHNDYEVLSFDL